MGKLSRGTISIQRVLVAAATVLVVFTIYAFISIHRIHSQTEQLKVYETQLTGVEEEFDKVKLLVQDGEELFKQENQPSAKLKLDEWMSKAHARRSGIRAPTGSGSSVPDKPKVSTLPAIPPPVSFQTIYKGTEPAVLVVGGTGKVTLIG
jgi:hypothetical protein